MRHNEGQSTTNDQSRSTNKKLRATTRDTRRDTTPHNKHKDTHAHAHAHVHENVHAYVHVHLYAHVGVTLLLISHNERNAVWDTFHDVRLKTPLTFHNGFMFFLLVAVSSTFAAFKLHTRTQQHSECTCLGANKPQHMHMYSH